jgi:hypothetical protein
MLALTHAGGAGVSPASAVIRRAAASMAGASPRPMPAGVEMDDALRETLRALGYSD